MKLFSVRRIWGILPRSLHSARRQSRYRLRPFATRAQTTSQCWSPVDGLTPDITSLNVTTTLNGAPSKQSIPELTTRLDKFAIYLPRNTAGTLA